jgi:putative nucleotidyltransferase with HDIG domain
VIPAITKLFEEAASAEREGFWPDALVRYNEAFGYAIKERAPQSLLETLVRIGHCHRKSGDPLLAAEQFELVVEMGRNAGEDRYVGRALNGLGLIAQARGALEEAEQYYVEALEHAERIGAAGLRGDVEQNLGIIANIQGNLPEALRRYSRGLEILKGTDNYYGIGSALSNLGMLHVDLGDLDRAESFFDQAYTLSEQTGSVLLQGIVSINRAELFIARGELPRARESCDEGFEIFSRVGDIRHQAEALKFYGVIYRRSGKPHLAAIHLQRAADMAAPRDPLLEAEAQRELALVLRELGRNRDALAALNRSHTLFTGLQAQTDTADIQGRIDRLEADFLVLVQQWGESIEAKDRYTVGHCLRVADYACRLAERVGIASHEMVWFRMGAFLHDLGKIEVPEEVLNKPGRLTDEERALMERHPVTGEAMLGSVDFPWDIRPMVRSHHERWDGGGYPDKLVGEAIPFSARILRVADVFDALTTARSYRRPLTPQEAMAIMVEDQGSFDAEIFAAFQELFPELSATAEQASSIYPA